MMSTSGRYLSPAEFGRLLGDLKITENIFQDGFLEFLEHERMVVPAARIRWPRSLVVLKHGGTPATLATATEEAAADALDLALEEWGRYGSNPENEHPLDALPPTASPLVSKDLASLPFEAWETFRTNVNPPGQSPLYVRDAVVTYYHDWQALLVADAALMGVHVIMDTRRQDLAEVAHALVNQTPPAGTRYFRSVSYSAIRGLTQGIEWASYLDAAARVAMTFDRMLIAYTWAQPGYRHLTSAEQSDLERVAKARALSVLAEIGGTQGSVVNFLKYLCERWNEWRRRGRAEIADEYKRHLARAVRMIRIAFDLDYRTVLTAVGHVTGHPQETLDVIFENWEREARETLERSLRSAVVLRAPPAGALTLTESDVAHFSALLERRQFHKLHFAVEEVIKYQFRGTPVDQSGLAKATEHLAMSVEHLINEMLDELGVVMVGRSTLMPKLLRFWDQDPDVFQILQANTALTNTASTPRVTRLQQIAQIVHPSDKLALSQILLRTVLHRNSGSHQSMTSWTEQELLDVIQDFLTALMFCRKQMLVNPPQP